MKKNKYLFPILLIYIIQLFCVQLVHVLEETDETHCKSCHETVLLNTLCTEEDGPCNNPKHHHHGSHAHDPSHCLVCKIFLQEINCGHINVIIFDRIFIAIYNDNQQYFTSNICTIFTIRAPPVAHV